jgi:hypothetical protein
MIDFPFSDPQGVIGLDYREPLPLSQESMMRENDDVINGYSLFSPLCLDLEGSPHVLLVRLLHLLNDQILQTQHLHRNRIHYLRTLISSA